MHDGGTILNGDGDPVQRTQGCAMCPASVRFTTLAFHIGDVYQRECDIIVVEFGEAGEDIVHDSLCRCRAFFEITEIILREG